MVWADKVRRLRSAQCRDPERLPHRARVRRRGIGLCRTEHMFFDAERITNVRQMILAEDEKGRRRSSPSCCRRSAAIREIFAIMRACRHHPLLDPPLHEFLPHSEEEFASVAAAAGSTVDVVKRRVSELSELNPMLGHRGCRLGITYPEIYEIQARAIFEAAVAVANASGDAPIPEVMVPLVATRAELRIIRELIDATARAVFAEQGRALPYLVGTMIELPRAALRAAEIAEEAEFFSFGTNDLTQTTLGVSRDDAGRFLTHYVEKGIYGRDPFVTIDVEGVGELIRIAVERGRGVKPDLKLGICGEHGGDPDSIAFCEAAGLDYVSASPYRIPIARLAAAQAALRCR
jgi:pyruvate,orthophosphate dikinase